MPRGQKSKLHAREKRRQTEEQLALLDLQQIPPATGYMRYAGANYSREYPVSSRHLLYTEYTYRSTLDEKVVLTVYYLLYKYQLKEPISKSEILRNTIQAFRNHFVEILDRAAEHLELVFGLDLREMEPNKHIYMLINKLDLSYDQGGGRSLPKTGLLLAILGVIFINGNSATEEQIWEVLNMLGLYRGRKHFFFGEPRKLINKYLVEKNYLKYRQIPNSEPPRYEFLWGPRAYVETSKMKVLEYVAKVQKTDPSTLTVWYEEALKDEAERATARAKAKAQIAAVACQRAKALACATRKKV
ncbi:melanoma-associated antigen B10-like [Sorex araneus]|uniref:melanoma-associated antigen B10-like n=1 Tax=Sorex araneus TaxID=42254 RepID=UPI00033177CB|nr:melanoma-associated antigen B10-like [Sorex araneus]